MQTLIDPFELATTYAPPPARARMETISIDVEIDDDVENRVRDSYVSEVDRESWGRVRCWCSED
jgi:hypothetical protein